MTETNKMTLEDAKTHVLDNRLELLARLGELRLAVYRHCVSHRMPSNTLAEAKFAENAQARAGLAADAAHSRLYSLLTAGIDDIIVAEETEAKGEAFGTDR